jgi:hypothetical protein
MGVLEARDHDIRAVIAGYGREVEKGLAYPGSLSGRVTARLRTRGGPRALRALVRTLGDCEVE